MIALACPEVDEPRFYDATDLHWIARVVDLVVAARDQPWREMVARIEDAPLDVPRADRTILLRALRRMIGRRRGTQLWSGLHDLAWFDVLADRPLALPRGRPRESELAAEANLEYLQRLVRRAYQLELRVWEPPLALVHALHRRGLVADVRSDGSSHQLALLGPLGLPHARMVYGRALASFVPLLAHQLRYQLALSCHWHGARRVIEIGTPLWLPPCAPTQLEAPSVPEQLAFDLRLRGLEVDAAPPPLELGARRLYPDLAVHHAGVRWHIEILAFSTPAWVASRLAAYREAEAQVVLCLEARTALACELDPRVCDYRRHIDVDELIASFEAAR